MLLELIREAHAFSPQGVCGLANSSGGGEAKITQTQKAEEQNSQRTQRLLVSQKTQEVWTGLRTWEGAWVPDRSYARNTLSHSSPIGRCNWWEEQQKASEIKNEWKVQKIKFCSDIHLIKSTPLRLPPKALTQKLTCFHVSSFLKELPKKPRCVLLSWLFHAEGWRLQGTIPGAHSLQWNPQFCMLHTRNLSLASSGTQVIHTASISAKWYTTCKFWGIVQILGLFVSTLKRSSIHLPGPTQEDSRGNTTVCSRNPGASS